MLDSYFSKDARSQKHLQFELLQVHGDKKELNTLTDQIKWCWKNVSKLYKLRKEQLE